MRLLVFLLGLFALCSGVLHVQGQCSPTLTTPSTYPFASSNVVLNGAEITSNNLVIPQAGQLSVGASAWHINKQRISSGFLTTFDFMIPSSPAAQGFAFVFHGSHSSEKGGSSGNMGYNFAKSLAVEFDTNFDTAVQDPTGGGHIEVHTAYSGENNALPATRAGSLTALVAGMNNGVWHTVAIQYAPSGTTADGTITVTLDGVVRLTAPVKDSSILAMLGDNDSGLAYVGFTGSTASVTVTASTTIRNWVFKTVAPDAAQSVLAITASSWRTITASNARSASPQNVLQIRDFCGRDYRTDAGNVKLVLKNSGGTALPNQHSVVYDSYGRYGVFFWHTVAGSASLEVTLENPINGQITTVGGSPFAITVVPGAPAAPYSNIKTTNLKAWTAGVVRTLVVEARDAYNNLVTSNAVFVVRLGSAGNEFLSVSKNGAEYSFNVASTVAETTTLSVRLGGADIASSPINDVVVSPAAPAGRYSTLTGEGLVSAVAGERRDINLVLRDQFNNPVPDGSRTGSIVFTMSTTGSVATTTVAYNATTASYTLSYTATKTGVYTMDVKLSGESVAQVSTYRPQVAPAAVSAAKSVVSGLPQTMEAGARVSFTIQARDAFENNRESNNPASDLFRVSITPNGKPAQVVVCGQGLEGSLSSDFVSLDCYTSTSAGRYIVDVISKRAVQHSVQVGIGSVSTGSYSYSIIPASVDGTTSELVFATTTGIADNSHTFEVIPRDIYNNVRDSAGMDDTKAFVVTVQRQDSAQVEIVLGSMVFASGSNARLRQTWTARTAGAYVVIVRDLRGSQLIESRKIFTVTYGALSPSHSVLQGQGIAPVLESSSTTFTIHTRDAYGNAREDTAASLFAVRIIPSIVTVENPESTGTVANSGQGVYTVTYTSPIWTASPQFNISIATTETPSPRFVANIRNVVLNARTESFAVATLPAYGLTTQPLIVTIDNLDRQGAAINVGGADVYTFVVVAKAEDGSTTSGVATAPSTGNIYTASLTLPRAGMYTISIRDSNVETEQTKAGLIAPIRIYPGDVAPARSTITGITDIVAGQCGVYYVHLADLTSAGISNFYTSSTSSPGITWTIVPSFSSTDGSALADLTSTVVDRLNGTFSVQYCATKAEGKRVSTQVKRLTGTGAPISGNLGQGEYSFTVTPAAFSTDTSIVLPTTTMYSGQRPSSDVRVYLKDEFSNFITPDLSKFSVQVAGTAADQLTASTGVNATETLLQFVPGAAGNAVTLEVLYDGRSVASKTVTILPGAFDADKSIVSGDGVSTITGAKIEFTVTLKDFRGQLWDYPTLTNGLLSARWTSSYQPAGLASGAGVGTIAIVSKGVYRISANAPTTPAYSQGTLTWQVSVSHPDVLPRSVSQVTVQSNVLHTSDATTANGLAVSGFAAGGNATFSLTLKSATTADLYRSTGQTVALQLFTDSVCSAAGNVTSRFVNSASGFINPSGAATCNPICRWTFLVSSTTAGTYYIAPWVNGRRTTGCYAVSSSSQALSFDVTSLAASAAHSRFSFSPALPSAGNTFSLYLAGRDQYDNPTSIESNATVNIGPAVGACVKSSTWLDLSNATNLLGAVAVTRESCNNGVFPCVVYKLAVQKAQVYNIVGSLDGQLIGHNCTQFTMPVTFGTIKYVDMPVSGPIAVAGQNASLQVFALDAFNNTVITTDVVMQVNFTRSNVNTEEDSVRNYIFQGVTKVNGNELYTDFFPSWPGTYTANLEITSVTGAGKASMTIPGLVVVGSTCASVNNQTRFRCPDGSCVTAYSMCAGFVACPPGNPFRCSPTVCKASPIDCDCDVGEVRCSSGQCVTSLDQCPASIFEGQCAHRCETGECRARAADCPSPVRCAFGLTLCPDGISCASSTDKCLDLDAPCTFPNYKCSDGSCVTSAESCSTRPTCAAPNVLCSDGSCARSADECPEAHVCPPHSPPYVKCPDGSCREKFADCPVEMVCPFQWVLCENGQCAPNVASCPAVKSCNDSVLSARCPDGSCAATVTLCPTRVTCPPLHVQCADGRCVLDGRRCEKPALCDASRPYRCSDGSCALSAKFCPTPISCPVAAPVRCPDQTCAANADGCQGRTSFLVASNFDSSCPITASVRCSDGSCRARILDCPVSITCPPAFPVRCFDGRCAPGLDMCANVAQTKCPTGTVQCPGGLCAVDHMECPTFVSCPANRVRCIDGTCMEQCPEVISLSDREENFNKYCGNRVTCPRVAQGVVCADSLADCPSTFSCPVETPVRCSDQSCALTIEECPAPISAQTRVPCPNGGWAFSGSCGQTVTCPPELPAKCWDETCRRFQEDCPPRPGCGASAPYLCPSGTCVSSPSACSGGSQCSAASTAAGHTVACQISFSSARTFDCVANSSMCANPEKQTPTELGWSRFLSVRPCPMAGTIRCSNGACMETCKDFTCPRHLPYACPSGLCVKRANHCPKANGCPFDLPVKCWNGACVEAETDCTAMPVNSTDAYCPSGAPVTPGVRCASADGCPALLDTDTYTYVRCLDGYCGARAPGDASPCLNTLTDSINACPFYRPYRCPDGYCAQSRSLCPIVPEAPAGNHTCGFTRLGGEKPVRCADRSCVHSHEQCPVIRPCDYSNPVRCNDGTCRPSKADCPVFNPCPPVAGNDQSRCPNGMCRHITGLCTNEETGCPGTQVRCPTTGMCMPPEHLGYPERCPPTSFGNGCPVEAPYKCKDGSCALKLDECPLPNQCPVSAPYLCGQGCSEFNCSSSTVTCPSTAPFRCSNGHCATNITECLNDYGCPLSAPVRCADGTCMKYAAFVGATQPGVLSCRPVVVCDSQKPVLCADGTCAASGAHCRPVQPCIGGARPCADMTCPVNGVCKETFGALTKCPAHAPALCPSGACKTSVKFCESFAAKQCPAPQVKCADGTCKNAYSECVRTTFAVTFPNATYSVNGPVRFNTTCTTDDNEQGEICPDGSCVPSAAMCGLVRRCPASFPLRCPNGYCVSNSTTCASVPDCPSGFSRCEDGLCRLSCLPFAGCPLSRPYYCSGRREQCVANVNECKPTPVAQGMALSVELFANDDSALEVPETCTGNCEKFIPAIPQTLIVPDNAPVEVDVSVDVNNIERTRLLIPAGAFGRVTTMSIRPVAEVSLDRPGFPFAQRVLSTPFACDVDGMTGRFPLNVTVRAAADIALFEGEGAGGNDNDANLVPCALRGSYDMYRTSAACIGDVTITNNSMSFAMPDTCANNNFSIQADLVSVTSTGNTNDLSSYCLCFKVVSAPRNSVDAATFAVGQTLCQRMTRASDMLTIEFNSKAANFSTCEAVVSQLEAPKFMLTRQADSEVSCSESSYSLNGVDVIPPQDICLGVIDPGTNEWRCLEGRNERISYPTWDSSAPRAQFRLEGRIYSCSYPAYAFVHIPLPAPPGPYNEDYDFWKTWGAVIIGVLLAFVVIVAISLYVIRRLARYRDKYRAKKVQLTQLHERARELDEYAGGLGVADEEVDMVANPLVVQMTELEAEVNKVTEQMARGEEEKVTMDELERERQALYAQITIIKEKLLAEQEAAKPVREVIIAPSVPPPTAGPAPSSTMALPASFASAAPSASGASTTTTSSGSNAFQASRPQRKKKEVE